MKDNIIKRINMFKYSKLVKGLPYTFLDNMCGGTGRYKTFTIQVNFDGDLVQVECKHKILIADGAEITSTGYSARIVKEQILNIKRTK